MSSSGPAQQGQFEVLYFAGAGSYTKRDVEHMSAPLPLKDLFAELEARYPGIKDKVLDSCLVTINLEYVDIPSPLENQKDEVIIHDGDKVAIIPPVSSG